MVRALTLSLVLLSFPSVLPAGEGSTDPAANAALKYWPAFATLPPMSDAESQKLIAEIQSMPIDAHARDLVEKADYALTLLGYGAGISRCDWATSYREGVFVRFPHAEAARRLAALACLRARIRFEAGQHAEAVEDLLAAMTLARHITLAGSNIMLLIGYGIENRTTEALAALLPKLDSETGKRLQARLQSLPSGLNVSSALATEEKLFLDWFIRIVKETRGDEELHKQLAFLNLEAEGKAQPNQDKVQTFLKECGGTREDVLKYAEQTRSSYTNMIKQLGLPPHSFDEAFARESSRQASNPVYKAFFPAIERMRWLQARTDVRRAQLSAALAVQFAGREALKQHVDPLTGSPFRYKPLPGGFELSSQWNAGESLRSKWKLDDRALQALTLRIGR